MRKTIKALKFSFVLLGFVTFFLACDKDFTILESDVLGKENSNFFTDKETLQILAHNKQLSALQINGLSSSLLGAYKDPAYGLTTASIITQLTPSTLSPDFGDNTVIDSVVLSIPYYYRAITDSTYTIKDSLYGSSPIKLSIYKNNYFLRDFDPSSTIGQTQPYYSKADGSVNTTDNFALNGTTVINFDDQKSDLIYSTPSFTPSDKRIKLYTFDTDNSIKETTYLTPAFRTKLDTNFWKQTIIDKEGDIVLSNVNNFNNYFRGLYFKAEAIGGEGNMILLNLASSSANITIHYSKDSTVENERVQGTYVLRFTGNILNTFINNYNSDYKLALQNINTTAGDEKLYLKGAEGSLAVVDLFSGVKEYTVNNVTTSISALEYFKKTYRKTDANGNYVTDASTGDFILKRLINDAQLTVYEDETINTGGDTEYHKYDRLYAYDIKNNTSIIDYFVDPTSNTATPYFSRYSHLGLRQTNEDTGLSKYKIRLTQHLINILVKDSTNTKIGLTLSTNVNGTANAKILNSSDEVTGVPANSIITTRGSRVYGTNVNVPENKRLKLEIFYTEPK
ncbi:DUF4270 domain-containing protein [Mariniflexile aquimaris]|uniref:DUF4270 domain-containing protein n=1 Tax=Mariniflexile aquimaris TaxID=881009 RepID=A0ABW3BNI2_9FLAO